MLQIICLEERIVLDGAGSGVITEFSDTPAPYFYNDAPDHQTDGTSDTDHEAMNASHDGDLAAPFDAPYDVLADSTLPNYSKVSCPGPCPHGVADPIGKNYH